MGIRAAAAPVEVPDRVGQRSTLPCVGCLGLVLWGKYVAEVLASAQRLGVTRIGSLATNNSCSSRRHCWRTLADKESAPAVLAPTVLFQ